MPKKKAKLNKAKSNKSKKPLSHKLVSFKIKIIFLLILFILIVIVASNFMPKEPYDEAEYENLRQRMVENQLISRDITDEKVLEAMRLVERHKFVPESLKNDAYQDNPLPIGHGQTISQPYIVALMTQLVDVKSNHNVLEIGAGSGYQAAILAELAKEVYTIEIVKELAESSSELLNKLYDNVKVKHADGYYGWQEYAPFDVIMITAASNHIPPPLLDQLADGGKLIIPLGDIRRFQTLTVVTRNGDDFSTEFISSVRFVPMTGRAMQEEG